MSGDQPPAGTHGVENPPGVMTLSEERLSVSLPVRISGRVRLIKYVETETVTQTVEVRRERLRVEESNELLTDSTDQAPALPYDWQQDEFEVILHEEQVEIIKRVVAVETVHVKTSIITTEQAVSTDLAQEQIELVSEPRRVDGAS